MDIRGTLLYISPSVSIVGYEAVFESKEVEHSVEAYGGNALAGCEFHLGLGMEGYAEAGGGKHGQVVGAVANGNCLGNVDFFYLGDDFQPCVCRPRYHLRSGL